MSRSFFPAIATNNSQANVNRIWCGVSTQDTPSTALCYTKLIPDNSKPA